MNNFRTLGCIIFIILLLQGCDRILEPVSFGADFDRENSKQQEEFSVNIKPLTFSTSREANQDPYIRKVMRTGAGSQANVFKENDFLFNTLPQSTVRPEYVIGIGDEISFFQVNEFLNVEFKWPKKSSPVEYQLGIGDQLTFIQQSEIAMQNLNFDTELKELMGSGDNDGILKTEGTLGSDGNILLLGLGNIKALDRSLAEVRSEVRNILIRNGLTPNFQLEITSFKSKKAFLTMPNMKSEIIPINNVHKTLKEIVLSTGVTESFKNQSLIILTRDNDEYRITAEQLFSVSAPIVYVKDNDQIEVKIIENKSALTKSTVGTKGNILLPNIGSISAAKHTLEALRNKIKEKLIDSGINPSFQLNITTFGSQKAYLINKNGPSQVIQLSDKNLSLRELVLNNANPTISDAGLLLFTLRRNNNAFQLTGEQILDQQSTQIWIKDGDQIEIEQLNYKSGKVFTLSGSGNAQIIPIKPSQRESLADILFVEGSALNNTLAQRSEIYLLRGQKPSVAYHLDVQNVSRVLVAAKTELRPNDIIFVAERPIISFARTLAELNPLRILLRDLESGNIP